MAYSVHSFLQTTQSSAPTGTAHIVQPPVAYYLILGRGAAAIVDHATLRQTDFGKQRLKGANSKVLPVLHVGMPDPWLNYSGMEMGQHPYLLILPGLHQHPAYAPSDAYMKTKPFADANVEEYRHLKQCHGDPDERSIALVSTVTALIRRIEKRPEGTPPADWLVPKAPYRAELDRAVEGYPPHLYAERIDICTGPGLARTYAQNQTITDSELRDEYLAPVPSTREAVPRRVVPAQLYLFDSIAKITNGRVLVVGGGPTAAWCVQEALDLGNEVWWAVNGAHTGFPASQRNDRMLLSPGPSNRDKPWPATLASPRAHVVDPGDVATIDPVGTPSRQVKVTLKSGPETVIRGEKTAIVNWITTGTTRGAASPPFPGVFDQVVSSMAQANAPTEEGSASAMTVPVTAPNSINWRAITASDGRLVGIETDDGAIRVLGAAGFGHSVAQKQFMNQLDSLRRFEATLCREAQVLQQGFTLCALTIALANQYFSKGNTNINTMAESDYSAKLENNLDKIFSFQSRRKASTGPYTEQTRPLPLENGEYSYLYKPAE